MQPKPRKLPRKEFFEKATPAMSDARPLQLTITVADAWYLVAALQMARRNPAANKETKDRIEGLARQFQASIEHEHPESHDAIEMGWWY